ncbi:hypothetical protein [Halopelagius fulvigenes]|uniref:DUF8164 domain-containing protein n=1 Tax=Halopelagius fulvigenes TaxID=1198324 RepID=A0ABD5TXC8_9EURY
MDKTFDLKGPLRRVPTATPKYQIVTSTNRISVSQGEKTTFSVYLTGYGEIERHKMSVFLDYSSLLSGGEIVIPFHKDNEGNVSFGGPVLEEGNQLVHQIQGNSATLFLSELLFIDNPGFESPPEDNALERLYPVIVAEGDWSEHAPIQVELDIAEDAEPGDYDFQMFLLYSDRLDAFQSSAVVEIHVQSKVEEYEPWPQRFAILGALIALASLIYQTGIITYILSALIALAYSIYQTGIITYIL